jgi:hypothetical protein
MKVGKWTVDGLLPIELKCIHGYLTESISLKYQLSCKMSARTFIFHAFEIQYVIKVEIL